MSGYPINLVHVRDYISVQHCHDNKCCKRDVDQGIGDNFGSYATLWSLDQMIDYRSNEDKDHGNRDQAPYRSLRYLLTTIPLELRVAETYRKSAGTDIVETAYQHNDTVWSIHMKTKRKRRYKKIEALREQSTMAPEVQMVGT